MTPVKLETLQGLRALAACLVVLYHVRAVQLGIYGVDIFFVISGFVISLVAEVDSRYFVLKRIFRVMPLYWLATSGLFALALLKPSLLNHTIPNVSWLVKSLFFIPFLKWDDMVQPLLPAGWTLNYEMFFYVVFGIVLGMRLRNGWAWVAAMMTGLVAVGFFVQFKSVELNFWTAPIILEFVFGLLLYQAWKRWRAAFAAVPIPAAVFGILSCLVGQSFLGEAYFSDRAFIFGIAALVIVGLGLSLESRVALPRWFLRIGDASYSLYLLNVYVLVAFDKFCDAYIKNLFVEAALIPVVIAVCIGLAMFSFEWIERPSNRWLRGRLHCWPFSREGRSAPVEAA